MSTSPGNGDNDQDCAIPREVWQVKYTSAQHSQQICIIAISRLGCDDVTKEPLYRKRSYKY